MVAFDYDDIQLVPAKCIIKSRSEADPSVEFGPRRFRIPVVPANMQSVINEDLAVWLAQNDYYYVMHRFQPQERLGVDYVDSYLIHAPWPWMEVGANYDKSLGSASDRLLIMHFAGTS